jgi:hypothetical protein
LTSEAIRETKYETSCEKFQAKNKTGLSAGRLLKKGLRPVVILLTLAVLITGATLSSKTIKVGAAQTSDSTQINATALQQMQSLEDEKASRTPAQRKINSQLLYAARMKRGEAIAAGVQTLDLDVGADSEGQVVVDISADVDDQLLDALK